MTRSLAEDVAAEFAGLGAAGGKALEIALSDFTITELAALAFDWERFWARPKQILPSGEWASCGFMTGRDFGKTRTITEWITGEIAAGRASLVGVCAQTEDDTRKVIVEGESGLLAVAPPWFRPDYEPANLRLTYPNGSVVHMYTAEVPKGIRGHQFAIFYWDEVAASPTATADEVLYNIDFATRLEAARFVWTTTPKRVPIIRKLLDMVARHPQRHLLVRGTTFENASNIPQHKLEAWRDEHGGTRVGLQELEGVYLDDGDSMFRAEWIAKTRRQLPDRMVRRILSCDPAITDNPRYSDQSGVAELGVGVDGQIYTLADMTGKHRAEALGGLLVDAYIAGACDLLLLETNRGGNTHVALVRVAAKERGQTVVVLGATETPPGKPGTIYVRTINNRGSKAERAGVAASLLEKGRVSFVAGAGLDELEEALCSFDGSERTPDDRVDAWVQGVIEISGAARDVIDWKASFRGVGQANAGLVGERRVWTGGLRVGADGRGRTI